MSGAGSRASWTHWRIVDTRSRPLSLRGHGNSPGGGRFAISRHGIRDYVDDVATVAETLTRPPVIVGHSMGGFIAQRYLCDRHPAIGAVLLAPVPPTGVFPLFLRLLRSEPLATATAVMSLDLGRLLHDPARAARMLFSDALDTTELLALHRLLGGESFRVFVELLAPRLDPTQARRTRSRDRGRSRRAVHASRSSLDCVRVENPRDSFRRTGP